MLARYGFGVLNEKLYPTYIHPEESDAFSCFALVR